MKKIAFAIATFLFGATVVFAKGVDPEERVEYYLYDHLGGVDAVLDERGNVVERRDYLPFGEERVTERVSDERHGFTGKEKDEESGLYYYGARYYDSAIGKFTAMDPLALSEAGKPISSVLGDPQQMNGYAYARNNPIRYNDPTGMLTEDGFVQKGDTKKGILETIEKDVGIKTDWKTVMNLSFMKASTDVGSLVGQRINIGKEITKDITAELGQLNQARSDEAKSNGYDLKDLVIRFFTGGPWDIKNSDDPVLGSKKSDGHRYRNYLSYIYNGQLVRYDSTGNINFGYVAGSLGIDKKLIDKAAEFEQVFDNALNFKFDGFRDDPIDKMNIDLGYQLSKKSSQ